MGNFVGSFYTPFVSNSIVIFPLFSLKLISLAYSLKFGAFSFGISSTNTFMNTNAFLSNFGISNINNTDTFVNNLMPKSYFLDISTRYESSVGIFTLSCP